MRSSANGLLGNGTWRRKAAVELRGGDGFSATLTCRDDAFRGDVRVRKTSVYNEPVPGTTFTVYNASSKEIWRGARGASQTLVPTAARCAR